MRPEELVARVFGLLPDEVADATGPETCEDWDSLGHLNLGGAYINIGLVSQF